MTPLKMTRTLGICKYLIISTLRLGVKIKKISAPRGFERRLSGLLRFFKISAIKIFIGKYKLLIINTLRLC
ncbi:MAG: hypothetical protein MUE85_20175, partial [Microscillaceae bacterium]|nr:hypothetical protein [Microscillaceae bacterium]